MRKILYPEGLNESLLIIQEKVYRSLKREFRSNFSEIDLEGLRLEVRDDPAARRIYTQSLSVSLDASLKAVG